MSRTFTDESVAWRAAGWKVTVYVVDGLPSAVANRSWVDGAADVSYWTVDDLTGRAASPNSNVRARLGQRLSWLHHGFNLWRGERGLPALSRRSFDLLVFGGDTLRWGR